MRNATRRLPVDRAVSDHVSACDEQVDPSATATPTCVSECSASLVPTALVPLLLYFYDLVVADDDIFCVPIAVFS